MEKHSFLIRKGKKNNERLNKLNAVYTENVFPALCNVFVEYNRLQVQKEKQKQK